MVVTDCCSCRFPHVLLRVQVRRCNRKGQDFQPRMGRQYVADGCALMPRCPVPQQQDRYIRIRRQNLLQVRRARFRVHRPTLGHHRRTCMQIQAAVETGFGASSVCTHVRRLAAWCPGPVGRRLQVQRRFVFGQNQRFGSILPHVNQFFSRCSSKVMTLRSRRDLKTFCVR